MRRSSRILAILALISGAMGLGVPSAQAACSVFSRYPCAPTTCSVLRHRPCLPQADPILGQDLQLTVESTAPNEPSAGVVAERPGTQDQGHELNTLREMFGALRACWVPPPQAQAKTGMQLSVRLSFKSNGELIGPPRITYASHDISEQTRATYYQAVLDALGRCTPLPFSKGLGGAIAGRPINIRFVDNRKWERQASHD